MRFLHACMCCYYIILHAAADVRRALLDARIRCTALHCILSSSGTYFISMYMHARIDGPTGQWQGTSAVLGMFCVLFLGSDMYLHVHVLTVGIMGFSGWALIFSCEDNTSAYNCTCMQRRGHVREFRLERYMYTRRGRALIGSAGC